MVELWRHLRSTDDVSWSNWKKQKLLVYSVESENKEEHRYILKFCYERKKKKERTRLWLLRKFVTFTDTMQYQFTWHKVGSSWLSVWKFSCQRRLTSRSGRLVAGKVDETVEKNWARPRHVSSRDVGKELNVDRKTVLNRLEKAGYKRKLDVWAPHVTRHWKI